MVDDADDDLLVLDHLADRFQIARTRRAGFESDGVAVQSVERGQRRLIALHVLEDALLARIAPTGVAPDLCLGAQALHRVVKDADEIVDVEPAEGLAAHRHHVNLRLFHLDHRTAGVGELVKLLVERFAERHRALDRVFVISVDHGSREQLGQDGAPLDRALGHALRRLPHRGVLQIAAADFVDHLREDAGFQEVVQDVAARIGDGADIVDGRLGSLREAGHVGERIALPAHAAYFLVVMGVAVGTDVEAGDFLRAQEGRHRVLVLLAVARVHHRLEEALGAERSGVPGRARQRADNRCRQHDIGRSLEHFLPLQFAGSFSRGR